MHDGLLGSENDAWDADKHGGQLVLVTLGGGHYARANQLAAMEGVWLGHMLATRPSVRTGGERGCLGTWKQSIEAGLEATRTSFPEAISFAPWTKKRSKVGNDKPYGLP